MNQTASSLYHVTFTDLKERLHHSIEKGLAERTSQHTPRLFFRADDIGVPSQQFEMMMQLFIKHKMPLALAVVPTWLTQLRLQAISTYSTISSSQWCWHLHGWLHKNHEKSGKKQEFGPARTKEAIHHDLHRGKTSLETLLGDDFFPFFTPPWNRCSEETLSSLSELQFQGLSRSTGALPQSPPKLVEIPINVDLHTRKELNPQKSLTNLLEELSTSLSTGSCGIMLHHQRMNRRAFHLLDTLLTCFGEIKSTNPVNFTDILR